MDDFHRGFKNAGGQTKLKRSYLVEAGSSAQCVVLKW